MMKIFIRAFLALSFSPVAHAYKVGDRMNYEGKDQQGAACGISFSIAPTKSFSVTTEEIVQIQFASKRTAR